MSTTEEIFQAMRRSGMNDWVGGADPALVARLSFAWVQDNLSISPSDRVLDFGCGIGRTSVLIAEYLTSGELVGVDIVPAQIHFCRTEIASRFQNASYYCIQARNPHYDRLITEDTIAVSEDEFRINRSCNFDFVVASSVFTHFDPLMAAKYLNFLGGLTKEGGYLALSWFFDHSSNPPDKRLSSGEHFRDIGNLAFALFAIPLFEELVANADLLVARITYGTWRGVPEFSGGRPASNYATNGILKGQHLQDVAILYRPIE
jgi:SAM-dependent methyltransferase